MCFCEEQSIHRSMLSLFKDITIFDSFSNFWWEELYFTVGGGGGGGFVDELEKSENSSNIEGTRILKKLKKNRLQWMKKGNRFVVTFVETDKETQL